MQLGVAAPFVNRLQPQADRRRHQRRDVNLMFFDQRETQRGARVSGEDHPPAGEEDAERTRGTHRIVMRRRQRVEVACLSVNPADLVAAADTVVVIVMGTRDQLRRPGAAAGELEKGHFVGRGWVGDKVIRRAVNLCRQIALAAVVTQQRHAQGSMFSNKRMEEAIVGKQRVLAVGDQQRRLNLRGVGVKLAALVAEQRVHRRDADAQQREEGDVKLGDVAQLHQRGFSALQSLTLQRAGKVVHPLVKLAVANVSIAIDNRHGVVFCVTGDQIG